MSSIRVYSVSRGCGACETGRGQEEYRWVYMSTPIVLPRMVVEGGDVSRRYKLSYSCILDSGSREFKCYAGECAP